jgi:mannose/fructose/N-acetylgalactosamine-specific phosphotransferase system component IIC
VENILIGLFGSLLLLDTTVAFQFLISQPLIACTLLGWFLGDIQLGLEIGFYLQLLWLSSMPIGAAIIPEGNVAAIVITAIVFRYNQDYQYFNTVFLLAVFYGVWVSYVGGKIVVLYRKMNIYFLEKVLHLATKGNLGILSLINLLALVFHYTIMFLLIFIALFLSDYLFRYVIYLPQSWEIYAKYGLISVLGIGIGLVLTIFNENNFRYFILGGLLLGIFIFFLIL